MIGRPGPLPGELLGRPVAAFRPLAGGMIGKVFLADLVGGGRVVVKRSPGVPLGVEARMLRYLREKTSLPVPAVLHGSDELLVLEYVVGRPELDPEAEVHCADLLAGLHERTAPAFGFPFDTLLGPFSQENGWERDWATFFGERRLRPMILRAAAAGLAGPVLKRLDGVLAGLGGLLDHEPAPALIHGDVWLGNVLASGGRIRAFLDPALAFADAEQELAYLELFATVGAGFFRRYRAQRPSRSGDAGRRRDVYQLYPLLAHVVLFGKAYLEPLEERLDRLGF